MDNNIPLTNKHRFKKTAYRCYLNLDTEETFYYYDYAFCTTHHLIRKFVDSHGIEGISISFDGNPFNL